MAYSLIANWDKPVDQIRTFLCDFESDLANLPKHNTPTEEFPFGIPVGSKAMVLENSSKYYLSNADEWEPFEENGGGGGGGDVFVRSLNATENKTYTAPEGVAYSPVRVNVPQTTVEALSVTANGTYTAPSGKAYSPVDVSVQNSYTAADEGKVVKSGALATQGSASYSSNNTYDTTDISSVTVDVPQIAVSPLTVFADGTYTAGENQAYSPVVVATNGLPVKDVNFYEDDGRIMASYTAEEFANLSSMPANPTKSGMVSLGWNWSLSDAKAYVASYGMLDIGQMHRPMDGKTKLYIRIPDGQQSGQMTCELLYYQSNASGVLVEWGDGVEVVGTRSGDCTLTHTYSAPGEYVITMTQRQGTFYLHGSSSGSVLGSRVSYPYAHAWLYKAEIGSGCIKIGDYAFQHNYNLESVSLPTNTQIGQNAFLHTHSLKHLTIPLGNDVTELKAAAFKQAYNLQSISIPKSVTSIETQVFTECVNLKRVTVPPSVTAMSGSSAFNTSGINDIVLPEGITIFANSMFIGSDLMRITIPSSTQIIGDNFCSSCYNLQWVRMLPTTPPQLGSYGFTNDDTTIFIPYSADHSVLATYQNASNWSTWASMMVEEAAP